uniref:Uncharacterized protein n=1 Tax=Romanomermis culicivorax TaxID=13658 RepID=A0A915LBY9_ROMCU
MPLGSVTNLLEGELALVPSTSNGVLLEGQMAVVPSTSNGVQGVYTRCALAQELAAVPSVLTSQGLPNPAMGKAVLSCLTVLEAKSRKPVVARPLVDQVE